MFTGIVEEIGTVMEVAHDADVVVVRIEGGPAVIGLPVPLAHLDGMDSPRVPGSAASPRWIPWCTWSPVHEPVHPS